MSVFLASTRAEKSAFRELNFGATNPVVVFMAEELERVKSSLVHADIDTFKRLQGRAGLLEDFLFTVEQCRVEGM